MGQVEREASGAAGGLVEGCEENKRICKSEKRCDPWGDDVGV